LRAQNDFSKLAHIRIVAPLSSLPPVPLDSSASNLNVNIDRLPTTSEHDKSVVVESTQSATEIGNQAIESTINGVKGVDESHVYESLSGNEVAVQRGPQAIHHQERVNGQDGQVNQSSERQTGESHDIQVLQHETNGGESQEFVDQVNAGNEGQGHVTTETSTESSPTTADNNEPTKQAIDNQQPTPTFIPTNNWLDSWKRYLPLDNILRIITTLSPQIQSLCTGNTTDEVHILEFLQRSTLVGLLPVPHPILIRRYQPNDAVQTWLLSYLWGNVYLQHANPPIFLGTGVKLFVINSTS